MNAATARRPVLVGTGVAMQREDDPARALDVRRSGACRGARDRRGLGTHRAVDRRRAAAVADRRGLRAGLKMPIGLHAIQHSAVRVAKGQTLAAQRDAIAARYERFARIAADNPHAWSRTPVPAATIREPGRGNTMIAFPYNRLDCSNWSVDQGAALLLCAEHLADALGVPRERRVHPVSSAESNHMVACCAREHLHRVPGWELTARRALDGAGFEASALDLVDLYSSFPIASERAADALGLPPGRDWTVIDLPGRRRTVATMTDERVVEAMTREAFCGRSVRVSADGTCVPTA